MLKILALPFTRLIGLNVNRTGHVEKIVSALGGLLGILAVSLVARDYLGNAGAGWLVASMGASAVLLFAVPHGPLSQPWPVLGGHVISAAIGVASAQFIPDVILAGAVAVGVSIGAMHYLRCIHPPGGATALTAVLGGDSIHALGYAYLVTPVLLDVLIILTIAVIFNFAFPWRRYPAALAKYLSAKDKKDELPEHETGGDEPAITQESLASAIMSLDKTLDISEEDLQKIYTLALHDSQSRCLKPGDIVAGRYYSNGHHDTRWQIRQVVDMPKAESDRDLLIYKIVAGHGRRGTGTATRGDFARWARHEVFLNENSWQRVPPSSKPAPSA